MKRLVLLASLLSAGAFGETITRTLHNLSSSSPNAGAKAAPSANAVDADQICKFCHSPHRTGSASLLWNHRASQATATWADAASTTKGTPLPPDVNAAGSSRICLSCHDGSVALGDLHNAGGGAPGTVIFTGADVLGGWPLAPGTPGYLGRNLAGNHPVSIPYAAQAYNVTGTVVISSAPVGAGEFNAATITAGEATVTRGANTVLLEPDGAGGYGVECSTCHDPHGTNFDRMLRVDPTGSQLCLTCHDK